MFKEIEVIDSPAGTVLFREGDMGNTAYLVESGKVEVSTIQDDERVTLGFVMAGDLLGEMSIIDDAPRSASATVVEDARLQVIHCDQFRDRMAQMDPTLRYVFRLMSTRFRDNLFKLRTRVDNEATGFLAVTPSSSNMDPLIRETAIDKLRMEADLWLAVGQDQNQLSVLYQPIIRLSNPDEVVGFEALLRWEHPTLGMVTPGTFIQLAEETPLITGISEWVSQEVIRHIPEIRSTLTAAGQKEPEDFFVAINISATQIDLMSHFDAMVGLMKELELPTSMLKLEITESQLAQTVALMTWVREAKSMGFQVAIDDFGTGYSSLSQLLHVHADTLKVDQSFVRDMVIHNQAENMVKAVLSIARSFHMNVVAEGIETEQQQNMLQAIGCEYGQGYLFGRPMAINALPSWLESRNS
jgi:EAL domain-containing protein (putative c-di-GMP-specific phosphodiesterase class I)